MFDEIAGYIKNPRRLWDSREKKTLIENYFSLSSLQVLNYILPLITFPYLFRVLGAETFGLISFAQALTQYALVIINYSFITSGTREIATKRTSSSSVSRVFSSIISLQIILLLISFCITAAIIMLVPKFSGNPLLYLITLSSTIGTVLIPTWLYQGMEKAKYITIINFISKALYIVLLILFVHNSKSYLLVPSFLSITQLLAGVISIIIITQKLKISYKIPSFSQMKIQIINGFHIFLGALTGNIYGQGTVFILGFFADAQTLGYYSVGEKIVKSILSLFQPLSQAIYPFTAKIRDDFHRLINVVKKTMVISVGISLVVAIGTFIFSDRIFEIIANESSYISNTSVRLLSLIIPFDVIGVILYYFLLTQKRDKSIFFTYSVVGVAFIPTCIFLTLTLSYIGTAISLIIVEIGVVIGLSITTYKLIKEKSHES